MTTTETRRGLPYKWIALSNTTLGILMATINSSILLIALPAGVWVDRWRKQGVLVTADLVRAAALVRLNISGSYSSMAAGKSLGRAASARPPMR